MAEDGESGAASAASSSKGLETDDGYDLRGLTAPRLSGALMRFFVALIEAPRMGSLLRKRLFAVNCFSSWQAQFTPDVLSSEERIRYPLYPPPVVEVSECVTPIESNEDSPEAREFLAALDAWFLSSADADEDEGCGSGVPAHFTSIRKLHDGYKNQRFTPTDVCIALIERIKNSNSAEQGVPLNAISGYDEAALLRDAEASTARWMRKEPLSCLDGVPVSVKNNLAVKGLPLTAGIGYYLSSPEAHVSTEDGGVTLALRRAGALCSIHTQMTEMGVGVRGFNPHIPGGQVRNPLNFDRVPGGSSSGAVAGIAAGLVPAAVGADGGGSIRIPSACKFPWSLICYSLLSMTLS